MKNLFKRIVRKLKKILKISDLNHIDQKRKDDYDFLIKNGVDTLLGNVFLGGLPIIKKHPNSKIIIGKNVTLYSDSEYNVAGINHPVIIATCSEGAVIEIEDNCGFSGTSIVAYKSIIIQKNTMFGVNTNIYDSDFHAVDPSLRLNDGDKYRINKEVKVGENVWVGANSTILKGVEIGNNSVVGANSLVLKNVPESTLYAGVPAKMIKKI